MRKITPCLLLFSMICIYASGQNVTKVTAYFKTTNEAKNDKSKLEIVFKTADNVLIASKEDSFKEFKAYSDETASLDVKAPKVGVASFAGSVLAITFLPCADSTDKWQFDCDLYIYLEGGAVKIFPFKQITLTRSKNVFEKAVAN
jgi:hypothetical protein